MRKKMKLICSEIIKEVISKSSKSKFRSGCIYLPKEFIGRFIRIKVLTPKQEEEILKKRIKFEETNYENSEKLKKHLKELKELRLKK